MVAIPTYVINIDGAPFTNITDGSFTYEPRDPVNIPDCTLILPDVFASEDNAIDFGDEIEVIKDSTTVFRGVVENKSTIDSDTESVLTVSGANKWYKKLSNILCDSYDFIQDNNDYGVTINPWEYKILRSTDPGDNLQALTGTGPPIDGFLPSDIAEAIIGTKFLYAHDFLSSEHLLSISTRGDPDDIGTTPPSNIQVYRNPQVDGTGGFSGHPIQTTPRLQLVTEGEVFKTTGTVESIPLYNGDPNINAMGNINDCTIRVYGEFPDDTGIVVDVCRNGGESFDTDVDFLGTDLPARDYVTGVINVTDAGSTAPSNQATTYDDVLGNTSVTSTYHYYEGSTNFSGKSAGNSLAYRITLTTSDTSVTPYIEYIKITCNTVSDSGISIGTIDTYTDTNGIVGSEFFEGDFVSKYRHNALSQLRFGTINEVDTLNHFWDIWIDVDGDLNFKKNRGTVKGRVYSFNNKDFNSIQQDKSGLEIWGQCVAYGAGSGKFRTRIVSDEEFSDGGLKVAALFTQYGDAAKVGRYEDTNAKTTAQLLRKARAVFKLHQSPMTSLQIPGGFFDMQDYDFEIGDSIRIQYTTRGIDADFPVEDITENFRGEPIAVQLGEPRSSLVNAIKNISSTSEEVYVVRGATGGSSGATGAGTIFDNINNGIHNFGISDSHLIDKVFLKVITVPFDINSRGGASGGITIVGTSPSEIEASNASIYEQGDTRNTASSPENISIRVEDVIGSGTYDGALCTIEINDRSGVGSQTVTYDILNDTKATTLVSNATFSLTSPQNDYESYSFSSSQVSPSDIITLKIKSGTIGTQLTDTVFGSIRIVVKTQSSHTHTSPVHSHNPKFGIWAFDGDSGTGDIASAVFATNVHLYVDLDDTSVVESDKQLPISFGDSTASVEIDAIDITAWLSRESNGLISNGIHNIAVRSDTNTFPNINGLGKCQFVIYTKTKGDT